VATWIERVFGRKADANLCVTRVMKEWLMDTWQIKATVVHDKPPMFFKPTPLDVQHDLLQRVGDQLAHCNDVRMQASDPVPLQLLTDLFALRCSWSAGVLQTLWKRLCSRARTSKPRLSRLAWTAPP
jgi:hypothetical protein